MLDVENVHVRSLSLRAHIDEIIIAGAIFKLNRKAMPPPTDGSMGWSPAAHRIEGMRGGGNAIRMGVNLLIARIQ
jgi:hypothetical protein